MEIGDRLKELRKNLSLSQEELATRANLTKGFISQLERNLTSPSIASLEVLLDALGTDMADFFKDSYISERLIKKDDLLVKEDKDFKRLIPFEKISTGKLDISILEIDSHTKTKIFKAEKSQEYIYLLEGKIKIKVEDKFYELEEEDSFYSKCNKKRRFINDTDEKARLIWIKEDIF